MLLERITNFCIPNSGMCRIDTNRISIFQNNIRSLGVFREIIIETIEHVGDRMVWIKCSDQFRRNTRCVEGVFPAVRFIRGIPQQKVGTTFNFLDLFFNRCKILIITVYRR